MKWSIPADTDVFKTSSERLKKVTTSYNQTRHRHVWKKTLDLRRFEDVWFTSSWKRQIDNVLKTSDLWRLEVVCKTTFVKLRRSDVSTTSKKKMIFSYFVLSEIFRKFEVFEFRLVFRYGILYKSMDWFIYDRNLRHEKVNHT